MEREGKKLPVTEAANREKKVLPSFLPDMELVCVTHAPNKLFIFGGSIVQGCAKEQVLGCVNIASSGYGGGSEFTQPSVRFWLAELKTWAAQQELR